MAVSFPLKVIYKKHDEHFIHKGNFVVSLVILTKIIKWIIYICIVNDIKVKFQFEDAAATKLSRKKRFGFVFLLMTFTPIIMIAAWIYWISYLGLDLAFLTELVTHFSPLSKWDVFSIFSMMGLYMLIPFILHRSYSGMETKLTKFAQLYTKCMHGVVCKGILFHKIIKILWNYVHDKIF